MNVSDINLSIIHSFMDRYGGAERLVSDFACKLSKQGFNIEFVTGVMSDMWRNKLSCCSNQIHIKELGNSSKNPLFWIFANNYAYRLKKLINKNSQILLPQSFPSTLAAARMKDDLNIPCIWYCHEPPRLIYESNNIELPTKHKLFFKLIKKLYKDLDYKCVNKFDQIIANSNFTAKKINEIYGFNQNKINVVYPGIDLNLFSEPAHLTIPTPIRAAKKNGSSILFCPGALAFHKNFQNILDAIKLLEKVDLKAIFIKGKPNINKYFLKKISDLRIEDKIIFLNYLSSKDMQRYYTNSDLVIYVPIEEPFGIVALEALANKTPIIASNSGGISEIIEDNITGFKVDPRNPIMIKEAIEKVILDPEKMKLMGESGYTLVKNKFNLELSVKNLKEIIKQQLY